MRQPRSEEDVKKQLRLKRFPTRTLLLMIGALLAFVWFWCQTHPSAKRPSRPVDVQIRR
jgi:hypothetical protein